MLQELYREVCSVLNKLTPDKFDMVVSQVQALPFDNNERLLGVTSLILEKVRQLSVGCCVEIHTGVGQNN
jgi:hypothetical protein